MNLLRLITARKSGIAPFDPSIYVDTWTMQTSPANNSWLSVCWSSELGIFCAVAFNSSIAGSLQRVMTSPDGVTWTTRTASSASAWRSVAWSPTANGTGMFVAVGNSSAIMSSPDGITWTARTSPVASHNFYTVVWCSGLNLFIAASGGGGTNMITSPDGITWTTLPNTVLLRSSAWSPSLGLYVATGADYVTTSNGTSLSAPVPFSGTSVIISTVCWSPEKNLFVGVNTSGSGLITERVYTSPDGTTWTARTGLTNVCTGIAWSAELGLFCSYNGSIGGVLSVATSPDGIVWTRRSAVLTSSLQSLCWSPELGIFCGVGTNSIATSLPYIP